MSHWQEKANEKRTRLNNLIPDGCKLPETILNNPPNNSTIVPSQCEFFSERDLEITDIDNIDELASRIARGQYSSLQVTEAYCKRAAVAHQLLNCLAEICFNEAFERARYLDDYYHSNGGKTLGPLHGIPISLKDQFNVKGLETAMGYIGYLGEFMQYNSLIVDILLSLGAVIYVKTTVPQTLMIGESRSNILGKTLNALNREFSSGGSSGGEGALIAMKGSICGLGTDIGGSIRLPASLNGIYALKPSDGRLPYGLVKNSLNGQESVPSVIGPLARSLATIRTFVKSILDAKPWFVDPKVHNIPWREELYEETQKTKLSFGIILFDQVTQLSPPVRRAVDMAKNSLEKQGHEVIEWDTSNHLEGIDILVKTYQADGGKDIQKSLESSGEPLVSRAFVGSVETEISVYDYWQLSEARSKYAIKYLDKWNQTRALTSTGRPIDAIISPICALPAYPHEFELSIGYTGIINLLQLSSVIIPVTRVDRLLDRVTDEYLSLPVVGHLDQVVRDTYQSSEMFENCSIGLQVICRRLEEEKAIGIATVLEKALQSFE